MQTFKEYFVSILLIVFCSLSAQQVRAELVATADDTALTYLAPLRNGISTLTLVWPIVRPTKDRVAAFRASLSSVVSGGTASRSSYQIAEYKSLKGIQHIISTRGRNILLTVAAPHEVFPETLVHLENLLLEPKYSVGWYERELQSGSLQNSSKTRRPTDVLNEIAYFIQYGPGDASAKENNGKIRFGRPTQVILRSGDEEVERRVNQLLKKLPSAKAKWELPFAKWTEALIGVSEQSFALPAGTIHYADPDSSEMLILFVKAEDFEDASAQIGANLLVDYIGANQGSEMFRIIREEMRAAYDPRSNFNAINKNKVIISLSASVAAPKWPEVYNTVRDIYESVRGGNVEQEGLETLLGQMHRRYYDLFFSDTVWGVHQYLYEYPAGVVGDISFPLFDALDTVSPAELIANSEGYLPPLEEFLLVLIGGGVAPTEAIESRSYCALPKNTPLSLCLDVLSNAQN